MITAEEAIKIVENVVELEEKKQNVLNKNREQRDRYKKKFADLVPYSNVYVDSVIQKERISIHADPDKFPDILFGERSPNQTDEQFKYVKNNYQCTTNPVWQDYLSVINRIFIDGNWSVLWDEKNNESQDLREYLEYELPEYGSLEMFMKGVLPPIKSQDANGVIAIRPYDFDLIPNEDGELVLNDQVRLNPTPFYHPSEKVIHYSREYVLCVGDEKSAVQVGDKTVKDGRVLWLYDKDSIFKIIQVGKKSDNTYAVEFEYVHEMDAIPCMKLKGVPIINSHGDIYWISRFYYAVPLLDLALSNRNIMQVSINSSVFPFRIMETDECAFSDSTSRCVNGHLHSHEDGTMKGICPKCNGTGESVPISPTSVYLRRRDENGNGSSRSPVEYISPDVNPLIFVREQVTIDTDEARSILHLTRSNSQVKGSENKTATGQMLDHSAQHAFVKAEGDQIFSTYKFIVDCISWQRYNSYEPVPAILHSDNYDFKTEAELWDELKVARDAQAPPSVIQDALYAILDKRMANDPKRAKVFDTIIAADVLFTLSEREIALMRASNAVTNEQLILHYSVLQLIEQLMLQDEDWIEKELIDRVADLQNKAKEYNLATNNRSVIDQIIENDVTSENGGG